MRTLLSAIATAIGICAAAATASAQTGRTFVSGLGSDSGACSRTAPCRSFSYAVGQTSAGGEVLALDSAGYGVLTITKAISIAAPPGVEAQITVSVGSAITINAGSGDTISLRGLLLEGGGSGFGGIFVESAGHVEIVGCIVRDFSTAGIDAISAAGALSILVSNTYLLDNALGLALATVGSGSLIATIDHLTVYANAKGITATTQGGGQFLIASITDSSITSNSQSGVESNDDGGSVAPYVDIKNTSVAYSGEGIVLSGGTVALAGSKVFANTYGVAFRSSGTAYTAGNNDIVDNTFDVDGDILTAKALQ